jgi:hypothetical protein
MDYIDTDYPPPLPVSSTMTGTKRKIWYLSIFVTFANLRKRVIIIPNPFGVRLKVKQYKLYNTTAQPSLGKV